MRKKINPFTLIIFWLLFLLITGIIAIPILFKTTVGGEQKPLTALVYLLLAAIYGTLILSVVTPFFYLNWFKKYWYVNLIFFVLSGLLVINDQKRRLDIEYGFIETNDQVNNNAIRSVKEYYSFEPEKIRSESYWKNGKKDSIWKVYAIDGSIIKQSEYKNDVLIKESIK